MTTTAVSVTGLTKRYGGRTVVDNLDIELPKGVVAGFVGPNGAGKTTTMAMLLGLVQPTAGTGTVLGEPLHRPTAYLRRVGALVESPAFYPSLSGTDNLKVFATVAGHRVDSVPSLLDRVGLHGRGGDRYRSYSLGMKQRLGIAAALLGDPELLILDEPANGLDPAGVAEMRTLVAGLADAGRTVLVSSHDLSELEQVCDWLVLIDAGRSLYQGPTRQLVDGSSHSLVLRAHYPRDHTRLQGLLAGAGYTVACDGDVVVLALEGSNPAGSAAVVNRAAFEAGIVLVELSPQRTTLEDRYLTLIKTGV